jgi:hypothetical protein
MQCKGHSDENMGEVLNRILQLYNTLLTVTDSILENVSEDQNLLSNNTKHNPRKI